MAYSTILHYHGIPVTPRAELLRRAGRPFCVSFAHPRDGDVCLRIGQSVLRDNGAFSAFTRGAALDERAHYVWLGHPHRAVVLDRVGGDEEAQRERTKRWPFP